jgi:threonine synthase
MRLRSSRNEQHTARLAEAIERGLAPDGGLYVPDNLPRLDITSATSLPGIAVQALAPFFSDDYLAGSLRDIVCEALNFPAPLVSLGSADSGADVLELFHGPTAAFKDFGARFLSASLQRIRENCASRLTILVATSGDTGGAVAAAFHRKPGVDVVVLFPKGLVSPRQEKQLTCWDENISSIAVHGTFDDCQRLVKAAFLDIKLTAQCELSSANSINIGRLLPQVVYYAAASLSVQRRTGQAASFIIPSGNLGNAMACIWARAMGLPIEEIVLAHNGNRAVPDYLQTGHWHPRSSIKTLASAMDVGNPSNMERLRVLHPEFEVLRRHVSATSVNDLDIRARIRTDFEEYGRVWCPHSAIAAEVYARIPRERQRRRHWVLVATAHPAKFSEIVEPLIGREVEMPGSLAALLELPNFCTAMEPDFAAFRHLLLSSRSRV